MKLHTLPVKRSPVTKGILRRLSAVTGNRKQRAAAATAAPLADMETEDIGSKISRALTILFLIHIVAIGLIFIHQRFLDGRFVGSSTPSKSSAIPEAAVAAVKAPPSNLPRLTAGEKGYVVGQGDNYSRIAAKEDVDEGDLRMLNEHVDIGPGILLKIPPKRIVAEEPPEVAAIRAQAPSDQDRGLVEAVDVSKAPKALLVRPNVSRSTSSIQPQLQQAAASGNTYVVQPGDSVIRIANRFKVNQTALMKANAISDPRKMKIGMKLVIPQG